MRLPILYIVLLALIIFGLPNNSNAQSGYSIEKDLQTKFVMAKDGDEIRIPEGRFKFSRSLWLDGRSKVVIKGEGMDKTFLSFEGQTDGAEGIKVTGSKDIVIEGLTVMDSRGDAIKVQNTDGIAFKQVRVTWSGKPDKKNGAYGLYPVMCSNVLIDGCEASGASDAGIYVGQSKHIIVKNSKAFHNVAGIEIENSLYADVFDNEAYENTGGVMVFDLPDLVQKRGGYVRVFDNVIRSNNYTNFAPKGNTVGIVPPGTGVLVIATNNVEIFDNKILNNRTVGTGVVSYHITEKPLTDSLYYPYPSQVYIHDNLYERDRQRATFEGRMGKMFRFKLKFGKDVPAILYDGIVDKKADPSIKIICLSNNRNAAYANIDAANGFKNIQTDTKRLDCQLQSISPAVLTSTQ